MSSDESFAWRIDSHESSDSDDMVKQTVLENGSELQSLENDSKSERRAKKRKNEQQMESPVRKKIKIKQESSIDKNKSVDKAEDDDDNYATVKTKKIKGINGKRKKYNSLDGEMDDDEKYLTIRAEHELDSEEVKPNKSKMIKKHNKKSKSIDDVTDDDGKYLSVKAKEEKVSPEKNLYKKSKEHETKKKCKSIGVETDDDENFLALKAKEESLSSEEVITKKSKKVNENIRKCRSIDEVIDDDENYLTKKAKQEEPVSEEVVPKKKKKKRSKELIIENNRVEETNGTCGSDDDAHIQNTRDSTFMSSNEDKSFVISEQSEYVESKITKSRVSDKNDSFQKDVSNVDTSSEARKTKQTRRISDRIRFEDDTDHDEVDINTSPKSSKDNAVPSSYHRHFLRSNPNLNPVTEKSSNAPTITENDEVWVLKCPHEMDVSALSGKEINLSSQCKIKMNGDSYCGAVQSESVRIALMTYEKNTCVIKNILCKGSINFRKRIPKLHIQDDRSIYQNLSTFIPLPETKSRHPLFGADYKKAIKVPKQVAQRLKSSLDDSTLIHKEKKKKKKRERHLEETYEPMESVKTEPEADIKRQKKKKERRKERQYTEETVAPPKAKKSKKSKHSLESLEVWESEKKIEESLFNF